MAVTGILPVIPTPFRDGRFDAASFERLLEHMLPHVDGYTLLGSTGEAPSLPIETRRRIAADALGMTPGDKTVIVGVSSTSVEDTIALARDAEAHGCAGVLCAAPYYFANTDSGILRFLEQLDRVLGTDLVLYDNPAATKTLLSAQAVAGWADALEHLTTVKLTDHDLTKISAWHDAGLTVLAGDDPIIFRYLAAGVDGVMVIAPAVFPEPFRRTYDLVRDGAVVQAYEIFAREILPFLHVFGIGTEIATTKALLASVGIFASPEVLPPLEPASAERAELLRVAYDLGLAESRLRTNAVS
jgi:4-hydroxy-tetrahydrodipicolinate synthase